MFSKLKIFPLNAIELKYFGRPSFLNRISFVLEKTPSAATNRSNFSVFLSLKSSDNFSSLLISVRSELKIIFSLGILLNKNSISLDLFKVVYLLLSKLN